MTDEFNSNENFDEVDALNNMDFNVEEEYKPEPLIPAMTYHGVVQSVVFNPSQYCIVWTIQLQDNGGVMSDGETEIDGNAVQFRNWLPKPNDENLTTKRGNMTKRQSKINMLKDFQNEMGIDMSTPQIIAQSLAEAAWVGIEVDIDVTLDEYMGKFRNSANRMRPAA